MRALTTAKRIALLVKCEADTASFVGGGVLCGSSSVSSKMKDIIASTVLRAHEVDLVDVSSQECGAFVRVIITCFVNESPFR